MTGPLAIDAAVLAPVLAPAGGALFVLVLDAIAPRRGAVHAWVGVLALVLGISSAVPGALRAPGNPLRTLCLPAPDGACFYDAGPLASALQLGALFSTLVVLLLLWPVPPVPTPAPAAPAAPAAPGQPSPRFWVPGRRGSAASAHPIAGGGAPMRGGPAVLVALLLAGTAGATAVAAATDLGSWLVALELATLPAIALVALGGTRPAIEGAVSLLLTSLLSFAVAVLGAALWVVASGEAVFTTGAVARATATPERSAVLGLAVLLLVAGLGFKLSLVPFHAWTPQAYAGGSEPVAAFLAATSKIAALAALVVVLRPLAEAGHAAVVAVAVLAAASMTVGNVLALVQDDPVRLLAWSTVAQAGWVVMPLAAVRPTSLPAAGGYVLAYALATLLAFGVVVLVGAGLRDAPAALGRGVPHGRSLTAYRGLLRTRPLLGAALGLALVSLAGLPPGILGLAAKVLALQPVVAAGLWPLALVAVANAVVGIAVYLRWFALLVQPPEPVASAAAVAAPAAPAPPGAVAAVALTGIALAVTCIAPQLVLGLVG